MNIDILSPIKEAAQLAEATATLEAILDEIGETPGHPLDSLARMLLERVTAYEAAHSPVPDVGGPALLAFLLEQRPLSQAALAVETGIAQSTISDLVNGRRAFTAAHARRLGAYFNLNPGVFL